MSALAWLAAAAAAPLLQLTLIGSPSDDAKPVVFEVRNVSSTSVLWACGAQVLSTDGEWLSWPYPLEEGDATGSRHVLEPSEAVEIRWDPRRAPHPDEIANIDPRVCMIRLVVTTYDAEGAERALISDAFARTLP